MFESHSSNPLDPSSKDVLVLGSVFYISTDSIKENSLLAQETLRNLYRVIRLN